MRRRKRKTPGRTKLAHDAMRILMKMNKDRSETVIKYVTYLENKLDDYHEIRSEVTELKEASFEDLRFEQSRADRYKRLAAKLCDKMRHCSNIMKDTALNSNARLSMSRSPSNGSYSATSNEDSELDLEPGVKAEEWSDDDRHDKGGVLELDEKTSSTPLQTLSVCKVEE